MINLDTQQNQKKNFRDFPEFSRFFQKGHPQGRNFFSRIFRDFPGFSGIFRDFPTAGAWPQGKVFLAFSPKAEKKIPTLQS